MIAHPIKRQDIIGNWVLMACEGRCADGSSFLPYGDSPTGKLFYSTDGQMSVLLMNSSRSGFASEDISRASSDEIVQAFTSFDAYCGRWILDETTGRIEHIIEAGRIPNWVGQTHVRYCHRDGPNLSLTTDEFSMGNKVWRVSVKWRRA